MNSSEIKNILRNPYNREDWKNLYRKIFQGKVTFFEEPYNYEIKEEIVESLLQIGYVTLEDEYIVALFEVNIKPNVNVLSKKIGLRKIISKYISEDKFNGVLTIFENGSDDYRFTFASKTTKVTEDGVYVSETSSKRFTYILGKNEPCITPSQRFENLLKKNGSIKIDDVVDAFSVEKLNKEFFNGYKEHYELLCNYFYGLKDQKKIFQDDEKLIRDFVKKFLGRIVFLYFVQKKGWLGVKDGDDWGTGDHQFLSNAFKLFNDKPKFYSKIISKIFFEYLSIERKNDIVILEGNIVSRIPYLNGGLFEKDLIDENEIDFKEEDLKSLFEFFDKFNFTIYEDDPNEQTVAVDPEMLGHIFENLLEDNKDKGAFYTPKEIVHYMCQESLIEYLTTWFENNGYKIIYHSSFGSNSTLNLFPENESRNGQLIIEPLNKKIIDRELIEKLLKKKLIDSDRESILAHLEELNIALDTVKICDPAIGSGAFPMGLLQEIYTAKQSLWLFENYNLDNFPSSEIKSNIIQNSIYGVDIEKGAVDIARLRFWLSLIVDEETPKSLPNLDYKILVGNSLVSIFEGEIVEIDWNLKFNNNDSVKNIVLEQQNKIYQLEHTQHLFFQTHINKNTLKKEIKKLKIEILQNQLILTKISFLDNNPILGGFLPTEKELESNNINKVYIDNLDNLISKLDIIKVDEKVNLEYFDWKLNFPEVLNSKISNNPGFDILIGNPPYIQLQKDGGSLSKLFESQKFETFEKTGDIYSLFYEKGVNLCKTNGSLCFITSNKWMRSSYGRKLRSYFNKYNPLKLIDLGESIFETATVDTNILLIQKSINKNKLLSLDISNKKNVLNIHLFKENWVNSKFIGDEMWTITNPIQNSINQKIKNNGTTFKNSGLIIYRGILTGFNDAFIIDNELKLKICKEDPKSIEILSPILRGRDIKRYKAEWAGLWVISTFPSRKIDINNYPSIKKYLEKFGRKIYQTGEVLFTDENGVEHKSRKKTINKWFETQDPIAYYKEFDNEIIVWKSVGKNLTFSIWGNGKCVSAPACFLNAGNHEMTITLLGFLHSKFALYFILENSDTTGAGDVMLNVQSFELLPFPKFSKNLQTRFNTIVDLIIHKSTKNEDVTDLEFEINVIIYKLFDLTYDEVKLIDINFTMSNFEYNKLIIE